MSGRLAGVALFVVAIVLVSIGLALLLTVRSSPSLPDFGPLPDFTLLDASGERFDQTSLDGRTWVASFFFTRCTSICPALTASMKRLRTRLDAEGLRDVRLVSFSVDPEHDDPEVLRSYAADHGIELDRWTLVTGEHDAVRRLLDEGFRTGMGVPRTEAGGLMDIAHSAKLVLVDGQRHMRGYFSADDEGLSQAVVASRALVRR